MPGIESAVMEFFQTRYPDKPEVRALVPRAALLTSGLLDSIGAFQLVGMLERRYGIEIADGEIVPENFDSVRQIELLIRRKLAAPR